MHHSSLNQLCQSKNLQVSHCVKSTKLSLVEMDLKCVFIFALLVVQLAACMEESLIYFPWNEKSLIYPKNIAWSKSKAQTFCSKLRGQLLKLEDQSQFNHLKNLNISNTCFLDFPSLSFGQSAMESDPVLCNKNNWYGESTNCSYDCCEVIYYGPNRSLDLKPCRSRDLCMLCLIDSSETYTDHVLALSILNIILLLFNISFTIFIFKWRSKYTASVSFQKEEHSASQVVAH